MLAARPGQVYGRLFCVIACLSALCSCACCLGWMVLRVLLCAELMFWLCCLVGFVCCNKYTVISYIYGGASPTDIPHKCDVLVSNRSGFLDEAAYLSHTFDLVPTHETKLASD
jgi:hypothetical protein